MPPEQNRIRYEIVDGVTVVTFTESKLIDEEVIADIRQQLLKLVKQHSRILINFDNVQFMSSSALATLVAVKKQLPPGGQIKLCSIHPDIYEIFSLTKMDKAFKIHPDEADALAAF